MESTRRKFIYQSGALALGIGLVGCGSKSNEAAHQAEAKAKELFFKISLAQWSLNRLLFAQGADKMDNLDFAATAKNEFGIDAIEYVNAFFADKAKDKGYLGQMKQRADDNGVKSLIIMIDREGDLGNPIEAERKTAVENHFKWVEAAKFLGCHSIRVNSFGKGTREEVAAAAVDGLGALATFAKDFGINVIVENHGSYSSDADWMMGVMKQVNLPNCGMLPDFGNFCVERDSGEQWAGKCIKEYDMYDGVKKFMSIAKAVSAKSYNFDEQGNETKIDYKKMMEIVKNAGYTGYVGVEYEGTVLSPFDGIRATKALLEKVGREIG
jgi:sugar phosphate isomerase/epimerase